MADVPDLITRFLLARLDEDEQLACAAAEVTVEPILTAPEPAAAHIARHAPERVLRDVQERRAIATDPDTPSSVLRHLAAVYEGHPSYHPSWAPPDQVAPHDDVAEVIPLRPNDPDDMDAP
jgi:uncharacterized protein DUF6221